MIIQIGIMLIFPVIFNSEEDLLRIQGSLNKEEIFPRRYFYPFLNKLPYVETQETPISESISKRILCLPLYFELELSHLERIVNIIKREIC